MAETHKLLAGWNCEPGNATMHAPARGSPHLLFLFVNALEPVAHAALREMWERWIGEKRFHRKFEQLSQKGWLEKPTSPGNTDRILQLTNAGRLAALGGRDPVAAWNRGWDGQWRIATFDVPEVDRALRLQLRRKLRSLGFGNLQKSVWITPDPIETLKHSISETTIDAETLSFLEARPCAGESDDHLVSAAWDFAAINRNYEIHAKILDRYPGVRTVRDRRAWLQVEGKAWMNAMRLDPFLPEPLLPVNYRGKEAYHRRLTELRRLFHGS